MRHCFLIFFLLLYGCGAVRDMRGQDALLVSGEKIAKLKVTAEIDKKISLEKYRLFNIYVRNLNDYWVRVKSVEVLAFSNQQQFNVILGSDLKTWLNSVKLNHELLKEKVIPDQKVENLNPYDPKEHIYEKFSVPSMLQTKKWILIQLSNEKASWMKIRFKFIDGSEQIYRLEFS